MFQLRLLTLSFTLSMGVRDHSVSLDPIRVSAKCYLHPLSVEPLGARIWQTDRRTTLRRNVYSYMRNRLRLSDSD